MNATKLRVLHIISNAARSRYLNYIADHHDASRFDVTIGTLSREGPLQEDMRQRGIPTFALECAARSTIPLAAARLAAKLRREHIDIIQVHLFEASLVGLTAAALAGTPLRIFTGHHSLDLLQHHKLVPFVLDCMCSRVMCDFVIAPSEEMKEAFVRDEHVRQDKIAVIPYGFDLDAWRASPGDRARIRAELGLGDRPVFGAAGRLHWIKDYPTMIDAFGDFAQANRDAVLVIVGDGPDRAALEQRVRGAGLANRVIFGGFRADLPAVLSAIDVFVHCSLTESFGQVFVEAAAAGKPLISTPVGIARELIDDDNGYLLRLRDRTRLVEALVAALDARDRWQAMGRASRQRIGRFAATRVVAAYERQYLAWSASKGLPC